MPERDLITIDEKPDTQFMSQYGRLTFDHWCDYEIDRAARCGKTWRKVHTMDGKRMALENVTGKETQQ